MPIQHKLLVHTRLYVKRELKQLLQRNVKALHVTYIARETKAVDLFCYITVWIYISTLTYDTLKYIKVISRFFTHNRRCRQREDSGKTPSYSFLAQFSWQSALSSGTQSRVLSSKLEKIKMLHFCTIFKTLCTE